MQKLNPKAVGSFCAAFFGGIHVLWFLLVLLRGAQGVLDWALGLHFIEPVYTVSNFKFGTAFLSILIAVVGGYVLGYFLAYFWNRVEK